MKKLISILLVAVLLLSFAACSKGGKNEEQTPPVAETPNPSKPQSVLDVEALIDAIGTITEKSGDAIVKAEDAFDKLSPEEQALVANHDALLAAKDLYGKAVEQFLTGEWTSSVIISGTAEGLWEDGDELKSVWVLSAGGEAASREYNVTRGDTEPFDESESGTWSADGDRLTVTLQYVYGEYTWKLRIDFDNNTLIDTESDDIVWQKL